MTLRTVTAALALVVALTGCGGDEGGGLAADAPLPTAVPDGAKIVVGDQNEEEQTLLHASGEIDKMKAGVEYANFLGGPAILEAFRAGAIDVATAGDTPPIQAQAAREDIPIVAARQERLMNYGLAIAPGAKIRTLKDLRGKKVAYGEGTGRQPYVLRALKRAGLRAQDVQLVPLKAADFPDAIRNRQVDAAPLNEPHLTRYLKDYKDRGATALPESETSGLSSGLTFLYASRESLSDPRKAAAIAEYVRHWVAAQAWSNGHDAEWIDAYYVRNQGLSVADGRTIRKAQGTYSFPKLDKELIARQQQTIDLLYEAEAIPRRLDAAEALDTRFDKVIEAAADEAGASRTPEDGGERAAGGS